MKITQSLMTLAILVLASCSSTQKAPLNAAAMPQEELDRTSTKISEASNQQYDQVDPDDFQRAVDFRNSAADKLRNGKSKDSILSDIASAEYAIDAVEKAGTASQGTLQGVLDARRNAVQAQAPQFEEKEFRSADKELHSLAGDVAKGKSFDPSDVTKLERRYATVEIAARKRAELGSAIQLTEQAKNQGATKHTPNLYGAALLKIDTAKNAIEVSPHDSGKYAGAVSEANAAARRLSDVLAIANQKGATEDVALTIYNQNKALQRSKSDLENTKSDLESTKAADQQRLSEARESADMQMSAAQAKIAGQEGAIAALSAQNEDYASDEALRQKIQELKEQFDPSEAEVMKDGKSIVVRLKKMNFATGRSDLNPDSFSTLQKVDALIAAVPTEDVKVEGHTDSTGSAAKNRKLSEARAEAVKKYLLSQDGLPEQLKVETEGFGPDRPLTTNKTKEGRATNRRVDIVIETTKVL